MLTVPGHVRVFVAHDPVDFRKSCDGLAAVVVGVLSQDALSGHVFVFLNRHRNRIKILVWDRNGYWLHYKRLERGTFEVMARLDPRATHVECTAHELHLLLRGVELQKVEYRRHFATPLRIGVRGGDERGERQADD
jgi:transposase